MSKHHLILLFTDNTDSTYNYRSKEDYNHPHNHEAGLLEQGHHQSNSRPQEYDQQQHDNTHYLSVL